MTTVQVNAVEPASRSELTSPSPVLPLAPNEPRAPILFYRLPNEMPWSAASTRVGSTREMELGMDYQVASQYPA
jgi:hypothetical protein